MHRVKVKWKDHSLNKHTKDELPQQWANFTYQFNPMLAKWSSWGLSAKKGEAEPSTSTQKFHGGRMTSIPTIGSGINRLPVGKLHELLFGLATSGLWCHRCEGRGREKGLYFFDQNTTYCPKGNLFENNCSYVPERTFSTKKYHQIVLPPDNIQESNLNELFDPLAENLQNQRQQRKKRNRSGTISSGSHYTIS